MNRARHTSTDRRHERARAALLRAALAGAVIALTVAGWSRQDRSPSHAQSADAPSTAGAAGAAWTHVPPPIGGPDTDRARVAAAHEERPAARRPSTHEPPATRPRARLVGVITRAAGRVPSPDTTVTFVTGPNTGRSTTTDADGGYALTDLWPGHGTVSVGGGHADVTRRVRIRGRTQLDLAMHAAPVPVHGIVRDRAGRPVAAAAVWLDGHRTTTDASGRWTASRRADGDADLFVDATGFAIVHARLANGSGERVDRPWASTVTVETALDIVVPAGASPGDGLEIAVHARHDRHPLRVDDGTTWTPQTPTTLRVRPGTTRTVRGLPVGPLELLVRDGADVRTRYRIQQRPGRHGSIALPVLASRRAAAAIPTR